jgi:hypothetical protein
MQRMASHEYRHLFCSDRCSTHIFPMLADTTFTPDNLYPLVSTSHLWIDSLGYAQTIKDCNPTSLMDLSHVLHVSPVLSTLSTTRYDASSPFRPSTVQYSLTLSRMCPENRPVQFSKFTTSLTVSEVVHITIQVIQHSSSGPGSVRKSCFLSCRGFSKP